MSEPLKKYLSVEEAAQLLQMEVSALLRAREQGEIRGFADRGTWKFKAEDVTAFKLSKDDSSLGLGTLNTSDEGSDLVLDEDILSEQPTVIRRGGGPTDDSGSDSDVRLIFDDMPLVSDTDASSMSDSDSDVQLAGEVKKDPGSDVTLANNSPNILTGSDSDVKLVGEQSISEIELGVGDSDSDVKLIPQFESTKMLRPGQGADETIDLPPRDDEESVLSDDSGISLVGDSGISLQRPDDSGISLASDSALNLASDSGISLDATADSGISLELSEDELSGKQKAPKGRGKPALKDDSGISLELSEDELAPKAPPKGKKPGAKLTTPMMDVPLPGSDDLIDTNLEVPLLDDSGSGDGSDSSYGISDSSVDHTSVITLDEDDEIEDFTASKKARSSSESLEAAVFEDDDASVEVAAEAGEDDELEEMEDVFGADDDDFDDVETGESHSELEYNPRATVAAVEHDWDAGTVVGLGLSTVVMLVCGTVIFDLVNSMWHTDVANRNPLGGVVLDMLKGFFG